LDLSYFQLVIQSGVQNNVKLTHLADLMLNDLLSSNLFGVWAEWQLPCDKRSPFTSAKQQNFDSE